MGFQECCYNPWTSLLQTAEDGRAGTVLYYSPLRDYDRYVEHDQKPRDDCCHRSNLCHLFYFFRPASSCLYYRSPAIGMLLFSNLQGEALKTRFVENNKTSTIDAEHELPFQMFK